eukprot:CAMPEP_0201116172 /NCGR_PEP_ID=MMETSP0850-20130426/528_1 /ASSEMBLY_ACC=CAM_ASM_000622 /TAXON_ID=183588 /ORGANISM="Pseudo-nitzschia fraudulenta, Strain WWA7" /LENGTH=126 /DNA_ID=CAMNT_0047380189 /DNA_START=35 /DNA_END=415 /DNA_ORIENTATION=+
MKFTAASTLAFAAIMATANAGTPDCQVNDVTGYTNCKSGFHVSGSGSDVLWCATQDACEEVFPPVEIPEFTPRVSEEKEEKEEEPVVIVDTQIDALEEAIVSASTIPKTVISGLVVAAASITMMLC